MSSMWSPSSSTTLVMSSVLSVPRRRWSRIRPGVPTTTEAPSRSERIWRSMSRPPTSVATRTPMSAPSQANSRAVCCASSRVGERTIMRGVRAPGSISLSSGSAKASVFPLPVRACTMRSSPARLSSRSTAVCTGIGCSKPLRSSARSSSGLRLKSVNLS